MKFSRRVGATGVIGAGEQGMILATTMTRPFEVVSQNNYTAPRRFNLYAFFNSLIYWALFVALTPLTQYFLQQGAGMQAFASSAQNPRSQIWSDSALLSMSELKVQLPLFIPKKIVRSTVTISLSL